MCYVKVATIINKKRLQSFPFAGGVAKIQRIFDGVVTYILSF
ncbi:hypothetical protein SAMN05421542_2801 [Chryseobacterium jejuense]|uniref:Uncharacterized protein n=1 Tax=Chryseobacterium jejuense TaxID=445960 RepID=A0A2X2VWN9_CHRJE|nr:hypothetical protein SAMN05421542_2801 [Chryseobacterium jejuense]SQB28035.1 Uncharacterised protein [Chryseobacterium jejuense]